MSLKRKVLSVADLKSENKFIELFHEKNSEHSSISTSVDMFYELKNAFDIIIIHWPEALFRWKKPTSEQVRGVITVLDKRKKRGEKLIFIRHNREPHGEDLKILKELYVYVLEASDAIVHLGEQSLKETSVLPQRPIQRIIPHGLYPVKLMRSKYEARRELGIKKSGKEILIFGKIRSQGEFNLIKKILNGSKSTNELTFLITGLQYYPKPEFIRYPLKRIRTEIDFIFFRLRKDVVFITKPISDEQLYLYFKAVDLILIPRITNLNSGILMLAISIGADIIGPAVGNLEEILVKSKNKVFRSTDEALSLIKDFLSTKDTNKYRDRLDSIWSWDVVKHQYLDLFIELFSDDT